MQKYKKGNQLIERNWFGVDQIA